MIFSSERVSRDRKLPTKVTYFTILQRYSELRMRSLGIEKIPSDGISDYSNGGTERRFSPYSDNGGSVVAIAGEDFVVIASDTRLSGHGYVYALFVRIIFQ